LRTTTTRPESPISGDFRASGGAAKNKPKQASGSFIFEMNAELAESEGAFWLTN
jgi:hypothetical protein